MDSYGFKITIPHSQFKSYREENRHELAKALAVVYALEAAEESRDVHWVLDGDDTTIDGDVESQTVVYFLRHYDRMVDIPPSPMYELKDLENVPELGTVQMVVMGGD